MTTLQPSTVYKLNHLDTVSWWEIVPVYEETVCLGYSVYWGNDHRTQTRITDNQQYTARSDKPSLSVAEQMHSAVSHQIARKGYSREIPTTHPDLPMLAHKWSDFKAVWPHYYIQPKYDGVRCMATPYNLTSRTNKAINSVPHIEAAMGLFAAVSSILPAGVQLKLDGELYIHGADLQTIQSAVSRNSYDPMMYRYVTYQVFDIVLPLPFSDRQTLLHKLDNYLLASYKRPPEIDSRYWVKECPITFSPSVYVNEPTDSAETHNLLIRYNKEFRNSNYEGVIVRNPDALYQPNKRTYDLLKYKEFADADFLITDVIEKKNRTGIFLCVTSEGKHFEATPAWTTERKQSLLRYKDRYIGRRLIVKYEKLSKDGIPLKPIGVSTRED